MKKPSFGFQLALAVVIVLSLLAILQGVLQMRRQAVEAANDPFVCTVTLMPELIAEGESLYANNCAGCHGAQLEGSPAWETPLEDGSNLPPPLDSTGHVWLHSDLSLEYTISNGRNLDRVIHMPAFQDQLTQADITSIIEYMKSKWGPEELTRQQELMKPGLPHRQPPKDFPKDWA